MESDLQTPQPNPDPTTEESGASKTVQLDKIRAHQDESHLLSEFWDWLHEQGWSVTKLSAHHDLPVVAETLHRPETAFAGFFGIDLAEAERERVALLSAIRAQG